APIAFDCAANAIVFDAAQLAWPLVHADPDLLRVLDAYLERFAAPVAQASEFVLQVRRKIFENLHSGAPSLADTARSLCVSRRSLQRRLRNGPRSYLALVAAVRRECAVHPLENSHASISEIAFMLGFSEVSTFHRAVKRWSGRTPAELRHARRARGF